MAHTPDDKKMTSATPPTVDSPPAYVTNNCDGVISARYSCTNIADSGWQRTNDTCISVITMVTGKHSI